VPPGPNIGERVPLSPIAIDALGRSDVLYTNLKIALYARKSTSGSAGVALKCLPVKISPGELFVMP